MAIIGVLLSVAAEHTRRNSCYHASAAFVAQVGGDIVYSINPARLSLRSVNLRDCDVKDDDMARLAGLRYSVPFALDLVGADITDDALPYLSNLPITQLQLDDRYVTTAGVDYLRASKPGTFVYVKEVRRRPTGAVVSAEMEPRR